MFELSTIYGFAAIVVCLLAAHQAVVGVVTTAIVALRSSCARVSHPREVNLVGAISLPGVLLLARGGMPPVKCPFLLSHDARLHTDAVLSLNQRLRSLGDGNRPVLPLRCPIRALLVLA